MKANEWGSTPYKQNNTASSLPQWELDLGSQGVDIQKEYSLASRERGLFMLSYCRHFVFLLSARSVPVHKA